MLNPPKFSMLDFLAEHKGLVIHWELLYSSVDADEDYAQLKAEEVWESTIDPHHMGLILEPVVDPNVESSSSAVFSVPSRTRGRIVPPVVPVASPLPPNVIAHHHQPPEDPKDVMDIDTEQWHGLIPLSPPAHNEVIDVSTEDGAA